MKITYLIILLLLCQVILFAQNQKTNEALVVRNQGRIALDNTQGFGNFIFGSPAKLDKSFKWIRDKNEEPSKKYFSKLPISHHGIQIDSVSLLFFKNKLYIITMYILQSNIKEFISYCVTKYGPAHRDLDDDSNTYLWRGKKKKITVYKIDNKVFEVLFIDDTNFNDRMELSAADTTFNE
jgi:hypothetical protein